MHHARCNIIMHHAPSRRGSLRVAPRPTTSDFVKTSRNNLSNKIENYKEVRQALRGTPWEIP